MIRIAVVDDHPVVRAGLRAYLGKSGDLAVVAEATNGREGVELVRKVPVDVVILDLAMPKQGGLEALRSIKTHAPRMPVLVLSGYAAERYALTALRMGASGYLNKACDPEEIVVAIRRVCATARPTSAKVPSVSASADIDSGGALHHQLKPREFEIFLRLAKGESTSSIATGLFLSTGTVTVYRCRLAKKLELRSNSELTRYAMAHGLL